MELGPIILRNGSFTPAVNVNSVPVTLTHGYFKLIGTVIGVLAKSFLHLYTT